MTDRPSTMPLGAYVTERGTRFSLWTTTAKKAYVRLFAESENENGGAPTPTETIPLESIGKGVFIADIARVVRGALYKFVLDDRELPDPYARSLPYGVHGPARVVTEISRDRVKELAANVARPSLAGRILYEIHIGTFTPEGTFAQATERLTELADIGINAIELMPLSSFNGKHGWGYDGVGHFAPHAAYGEPDDLRALIRRAHELGMLVFLDAVYNHFGPEGNYLGAYAPEYFTHGKQTAWGDPPNFENLWMRQFVLSNARYWLEQYGFDGLRLDATHALFDPPPKPIVRDLSEMAHRLEPPRLLVAEDERNEPALILRDKLDGIWADDFHHQLRVLLTGERDGYYAAYEGNVAALAETIRKGWFYQGQQYAPTKKNRGKPADDLSAENFVYCIQNHDQVGNRAFGTRLNHDVPLEAYMAASTLLLFLPMTPLLFMGQEWAASSPFLYFTDHGPELGAKITAGRREEFRAFPSFAHHNAAQIPDPQDPATFARSKLNWAERSGPDAARVLELYRRMIQLRRSHPALVEISRAQMTVVEQNGLLVVTRKGGGAIATLCVNFGTTKAVIPEGTLAASPHILFATPTASGSDFPSGSHPSSLEPNAAIVFSSAK